MIAIVPLAFALGLDPCSINEQVQQTLVAAITGRHGFEMLPTMFDLCGEPDAVELRKVLAF